MRFFNKEKVDFMRVWVTEAFDDTKDFNLRKIRDKHFIHLKICGAT